MPIPGKPSFDDEILEREKPLENSGPNPEVDDEVMLVRIEIENELDSTCVIISNSFCGFNS